MDNCGATSSTYAGMAGAYHYCQHCVHCRYRVLFYFDSLQNILYYECINTAGGKEVDGENKIDSDAIRWFNDEKEMWEISELKLGEGRGWNAADVFVDYDAKFSFICQYI